MGVCYRTTSQVFCYDTNARLRDLLSELRDERVLLMGDFNYPGVDWVGVITGERRRRESCLWSVSRTTFMSSM